MRIQQTANPDALVLRHSLGCASLFLFLFGVIIIACSFIPAEVRGGDEFPWYIGLPIGLCFLAVGTYRKTITLDRTTRRLETCKRVVGYAYRREARSLGAFDRVAVGSRIKRGDNSRYTVYFVALAGSSTFELVEEQNSDSARRWAEQVAKFLRLPLHDASSGKLIVDEVESLGVSLRDQVERTGKRRPLPEPPKEMLTVVDVSHESRATLSVPAKGWSLRSVASMLPTCAFGAFFIWLTHDAFKADRDVGELVISTAALSFGILLICFSLAYVILDFTRRVTVTASADQVEIKSVSLLGWRTRVFDAGEIEDVFVNHSPAQGRSLANRGVAIRDNDKTFAFGSHLPVSEQEFLSRLLRAILEG